VDPVPDPLPLRKSGSAGNIYILRFPQFFQANSLLSRVSDRYFLPHHFQFIIHFTVEDASLNITINEKLLFCSVASCLWCLQIKMEGLPSHKQMFFNEFTTCFGPDRPSSGAS
jgi:hypothetical protein